MLLRFIESHTEAHMKRPQTLTAVAWAMFLGGCGLGPLDLLGVDAAVTQSKNKRSPSNPLDDRIEDKNPSYAPSRVIEETVDGCEFRLNKSATVTKLDIAPLEGGEKAFKNKVFRGRSHAIAAVDKILDSDAQTLIPSMEVVSGALKPFNDGLYASIEVAVQEGVEFEEAPDYPSKAAFLKSALAELLDLSQSAASTGTQVGYLEDAAVDIAAALTLAGESFSTSSAIESEATARAQEFLKNSLYSKPIGFYTWNEALEGIFRQDRYLQNYQGEDTPYLDDELGKAAALALALDGAPELLEHYQGYLALYAGLTNPFMNHPVTALLPYLEDLSSLDDIASVRSRFLAQNPPPDLLPPCQPHFAVFPSSTSKETAYFESRYCAWGAPGDTNYMDELIIAIRDGLLDLQPGENSGWYDYQSYALETLLLPERAPESEHLLLTKAYKKKLLETFKSIMTQNRETHVKQLEMGVSAKLAMEPMSVDLYPLLPAEPFSTFYLRSARAYRFLADYLGAVLGTGFLKSVPRMRGPSQLSKRPLSEDLGTKAELLYGLYYLTADAVGLEPALLEEETLEFNEGSCRTRAAAWLLDWRRDEDVLTDPRVMVPVQRDEITKETIYWAVIGVKAIKAKAEFVEGFEPRDIESDGYCWTGEFAPREYFLLTEAFAEVRLPSSAPPPTRDELREICDKNDSVDEIVSALEDL